jgi:hypothetical protein
MFGSSFNLAAAGLGDLPSDILVPGVAVFSRRALPLAAWTNGLEISGVWWPRLRSTFQQTNQQQSGGYAYGTKQSMFLSCL